MIFHFLEPRNSLLGWFLELIMSIFHPSSLLEIRLFFSYDTKQKKGKGAYEGQNNKIANYVSL